MPTTRKALRSQSLIEKLSRANPIKMVVAGIASLAVIFGAGVAVDERYAHAGDLRSLSGQLEVNRLTAEVSVLEMRRSALEDKVYDAAARKATQQKKASVAEHVITQRYEAELKDVVRQVSEKRQVIDQLRSKK